MKPDNRFLISAILTGYLIAGIFGPCIILGTLITPGNGNLYYQESDGSADYHPTVVACRRHIIPEKRPLPVLFCTPVIRWSDQDVETSFLDPDSRAPDVCEFRHSKQRPRDPPDGV